MALRGKKPQTIEKRLKALFYGNAGSGKTTASIQFPRPYLIDTERGAENDQYVKMLEKSGGVIFQTTSFDELKQEVTSLLTEKHEYKTLIIDPLTVVYNDLIDKAGHIVGTDFGRHISYANTQVKTLLNLLLRLDMNVIITSHSKVEYGDKMVVLGQTFDCYKKLDYLFDLVFEVQKRGQHRVGIVKKSRIESFSESETFPFCYDEIANRYGREILERDAVPEVLANEKQVTELKRLIELLKVDSEATDKWLAKANAERFEEMKSEDVDKCINHLNNLIKGK